MDTLDREAATSSDHAQPTASHVDVHWEPLKPTKQPLMTIDQLYALGFRLFVGLCLGFLFFVAAIYYQVINP